MHPLWDPALGKTQFLSSFLAQVPGQVWTPQQRVTHAAPSGSRGLGQLQNLFPREIPLLLSRFGCSCCQAEDREGQVLCGACWGFV